MNRENQQLVREDPFDDVSTRLWVKEMVGGVSAEHQLDHGSGQAATFIWDAPFNVQTVQTKELLNEQVLLEYGACICRLYWLRDSRIAVPVKVVSLTHLQMQ